MRAMPQSPADRSYRALLAVPSLVRVVAGMQLGRVAGGMVSVAVVLFTLTTYHSAELAGIVTFVSLAPGMLVSPIAGALLDRHGRSRLVLADYVVAAVSFALIGTLALAAALPAWLLVLISAVASLTNPLSTTGLRSLFPLLVPRHLWERINAIDSMGYVVATIIGPPLAGALVALWGGPVALIAVAAVFVAAAVVAVGIPDPQTDGTSTGRLLVDAWQGLRYTWRNPTLRALGFSISALNLAGGVVTIVVPLIVLDRLHQGPATAGAVFAASGVGGGLAALAFGRINSAGRERAMLVVPMLGTAGAMALLLGGQLGLLVASMTFQGLLNGPMDIGLFTLRQRRTDPAWMGRAFAVSMSFNFAGFPVGSALAGWIASRSIEGAVLFAVAACLLAALIAWRWIPRTDASEPGERGTGRRVAAGLEANGSGGERAGAAAD
jgi:MFS family permease